jgi:phage tail sheath protein FI
MVAPSGAIAGLWAQSDTMRGVWVAPAGYTLAIANIYQPAYLMTDDQQGDFNMPPNGMAIDVIRSLTGYGTVAWGARTLDGASEDLRYVQVRRTLIYIEQSIKGALNAYMFAPNTSPTWVSVTAAVSNFLTQLWSSGGLMGDKPSDAFSVQCGVGSTMTAQDVIDGHLIVSISLQMIRPAEFIQLTIMQQMAQV